MTEKESSKQQGLKPCPFCGGEGELSNQTSCKELAVWVVSCKKCEAEMPPLTPSADDAYEAIKAWNTRTRPDTSEVVEVLERCEFELREANQWSVANQAKALITKLKGE